VVFGREPRDRLSAIPIVIVLFAAERRGGDDVLSLVVAWSLSVTIFSLVV
jgi:hypothetical protein